VSVRRSRISQILQAMSLGRKKNASRRRAGLGSEPQAARRVPSDDSEHCTGEADFSG